jgi:hypothetical protein
MSDSPLVGMNRDALHDQLELARLKITQRERSMWHIGHSTGEFRLCRDKVAVAAQSQSSMA